MGSEASQQQYKTALRLFEEGRYRESLGLLNALNEAHPNKKHIIYMAALCLEKLDRGHKALPLCEQLIAQFQDVRAEALKQRIRSLQASAGPMHSAPVPEASAAVDLDTRAIDDVLYFDPPSRVAAYTPVQSDRDWMRFTLIGIATLVVLAAVVIPVMLYEPSPLPPLERAEDLTVDHTIQAVGPGLSLLIPIISFVSSILGGICGLIFLQRLPHTGFWENFLHVSLTQLVFMLLCIVPFIGWIFALIYLARRYELGCGGLIVYVIAQTVAGSLALAIPYWIVGQRLLEIMPK